MITLNTKIGNSKTSGEILKEVMIQANYISIVKKGGVIETVRIIDLLAKAE